MSEKKTLYHSGLSSPTTLTVESEARKSKWADKNGLKETDPGYYYLFVKINGVEHTLTAETKAIAEQLSSFKGKGPITVTGEGKKESATIKIEQNGQAATPSTPSSAPSLGEGLSAFENRQNQVKNAIFLNAKAAAEVVEAMETNSVMKFSPELQLEVFKSLLIGTSSTSDQLPTTPLWLTN